MNKNHIIIYIHGFGMQKDDRGLLTGIADVFPDSINILTDMNSIDVENKTLTVEPITKQVQTMNEVLERIKADYPDAHIDIVAHSQGSVIASLMKDIPQTSKIIFLAPSFDFDRERTASVFTSREGTVLDFDGTSTFIRRDGSTTYVPKEYWTDRDQYNPVELFKTLSEKNKIHIILAEGDDLVRNSAVKDFDNNPNVTYETLPGNHNFDHEARAELLKRIKELLK
jgi:hypothetical protein